MADSELNGKPARAAWWVRMAAGAGLAAELELGEETVRSHIKKAQAKLQAHNRTHAVAQALRLRLIP